MSNTYSLDTKQDAIDVSHISTLPVSDAWKAKFYLIERAGGIKLQKFKELSFGERIKVNNNILCFLFGPIYYIIKGMWKKGITLSLIILVISIPIILGLESLGLEKFEKSLGYGFAAIYAARANRDYYKKMVLDENGWL